MVIFYKKFKASTITKYNPIIKHKPENYIKLQNSSRPLILECKKRIDLLMKEQNIKKISILDICCASGRHLNALYEFYGNKIEYNGFDINKKNKKLMKKNFFSLYKNSTIKYLDIKKFYIINKKKFNISFCHGRSLDLVKPNFNLVKYICKSTLNYVILINISNENNSFQRFWDYEFCIYGFKLIKNLFPESSYSKLEVKGNNRKHFFKVYKKIYK